MPTDEQRSNLLKLADYLDSLPEDYQHFDMATYIDHRGDCDIDVDELILTDPKAALFNCGTVACAAGHGPVAGIPLEESDTIKENGLVDWEHYCSRAFGDSVWGFLFSGEWESHDNHHYGAAARIRYYLEHGVPRTVSSVWWNPAIYESYRKDAQVHG